MTEHFKSNLFLRLLQSHRDNLLYFIKEIYCSEAVSFHQTFCEVNVSTEIKTFPRVTAKTLFKYKREGRKIVCLTAYDAIYAAIEENAGVDLLLVGDSAGNVIAGHTTTIPMTMDSMLFLTRCVARGSNKAMVIADMPFG
ncbi:3-methyl-2-oxobutanoate hydroxymethyltransferase, partial [bacterium]|nr:3-methyl-2-oxobutanoate hydroxymethyltransferase [bacterium]